MVSTVQSNRYYNGVVLHWPSIDRIVHCEGVRVDVESEPILSENKDYDQVVGLPLLQLFWDISSKLIRADYWQREKTH